MLKKSYIVLLLMVMTSNLFAFSDADNDGMMDSWESKYSINSPSEDPDGDGLTNLQEFIMQTDPTVKTQLQFIDTGKVTDLASANWIEKYKDYWIVATDNSTVVFDNNWTQVSKIDMRSNRFTISGDKLYGTKGGVLTIIALSDIHSLSVVSSISDSTDLSNDWYFYADKSFYINKKFIQLGRKSKTNEFGQYVYKTVMLLYDVSNPSTPQLQSEFELADGDNFNIYYYSSLLSDGSTLFLSDSNFGTKKAIDISDPKHPKFVDKSNLSGKVGNLYYANGTVYNVTELTQYGLTLTSDHSKTYIDANTSQPSLPSRNFAIDGTNIYVPTSSGLKRYILGPKIPEATGTTTGINFTKLSDLPGGSKIVEFDYNGQSDKTNKYLNIYSFDTTNKKVNLKKYYLDGSLISDVNGTYSESYAGAGINIDIDGDYFVFVSSNGKLAKLKDGVAEYVDGEISSKSIENILSHHNKRYYLISQIKNQYLDPDLDPSYDSEYDSETKYDFSEDGKYLYLSTPDGISIYNIENISSPKYIKTFQAIYGYGKIKIVGNILYYNTYWNEDGIDGYYTYKYSIKNPIEPKYISIEKEQTIDFSKEPYVDDNLPINCSKVIKIKNQDAIICLKNFGDSYHFNLEFYNMYGYDRDFDGVPDKFDLYPDDKTKFFLDSDNDGKIDKVNPNTNPSDAIYNGYYFDDSVFHLSTTAQRADKVNLFLSNSDENISIDDFDVVSIFDKSNSYTSYVLSFENFDSYLVTQLYNINFDDNNLIDSNSKEDNPQLLSLANSYTDKISSDNSGVDKRYVGFQVNETGNYSIVILKQDGLSSLIKIDTTKESKITAKIYKATVQTEKSNYYVDGYDYKCDDNGCFYEKVTEGEKELLGEKVLDPEKFSSIKMPLEKGNKYYLSFDLKNIKQFKYNIIVVKNYENYFEEIQLDNNGSATYSFVAPKSTTYQYVLSANRKFKSKLYLGSSLDDAHILSKDNGKFINDTIGLRASVYTIKIEGKPNDKVTFVLGESDKRKEIEPNNTYQSATAIDAIEYVNSNTAHGIFDATLKVHEVDYYKINANGTFSVTITPKLHLTNEEISKYQFNMFVYNASGDIVNKDIEYLEDDSITYNFNVGSGTYFLRFSSNYDKDFNYTLKTRGTSTPQETQTEVAYAQKYNSYILGRGLNLEASTQEVQDSGELIILAGDGDDPNDPLYEGVQKLSENMYDRFLLRGLSHKDIYYLNATTRSIDIDNDGIPDDIVDDKHPTKESFYKTITDRASSDKKGPLFIYMVDHGANGSFKIDSNNIVTATELKKAIDTFISSSGREVVVMIEACKSGSFIPILTENGTRDDILVITSSQKGKLSYIDRFGNVSFTKFLADSILSGNSIKDAFESAKNKLKNQGGVYALQVPQISSGSDENLLNFKVGGNFATASMTLVKFKDYFGKDKSSFDISTLHKDINLYATIDGNGGVNRVWATVIPPNYQPPVITDDSFQTPDMTPYTVELKYDADSKRYVGVYDKLDAPYEGKYSITYYIEDSDGNIISKAITMEGKNIDSQIAEQTNKPVFELSKNYLEVTLNSSDTVTISALGDYNYSVSSEDETIATASFSKNKLTINAKDLGQTTIKITATNNGYTTTKELVVKVKDSDSVKKLTLNYGKGWTLISPKTVNSIVPSSIANIVISWKYVNGKWQVYAKDVQMAKKVADAGFKSMDEIKAGEGGWIYTTSSGKITQIGTPYNILGDDLSQKLRFGWNLIGTGEDLSIKNLYAKIATYGSDISSIWVYRDGKWAVYTKDLFYLESIKEKLNIKTLDSIKAGEGFWIYVE